MPQQRGGERTYRVRWKIRITMEFPQDKDRRTVKGEISVPADKEVIGVSFFFLC
jgi:hypothetical protein